MKKIKIAAILLLATTLVAQMNEGYGQSKPLIKKVDNAKALVFVSAKNTSMMLTRIADARFELLNQPNERQVCVFIDPTKTFQTMVGIGGALTDASAEVFAKLPPAAQKELINAYYDKEKGIG